MKIPAGYLVFRCREEVWPDGRQSCRVWLFWCPFCRKEHVHGAMPGHRVAHCHNPDSPMHDKGYYLIAEPKPKQSRKSSKPTPAAVAAALRAQAPAHDQARRPAPRLAPKGRGR